MISKNEVQNLDADKYFLTNGLVLRTAPEGVGDWARGRERDR